MCGYCEKEDILDRRDGRPIYIKKEGILVIMDQYAPVYRGINYCPMCGKRLNMGRDCK